MRSHSLVVQTSVSTANAPQAAVVGAVVTDAFEIVFDTLASTRKAANLRVNPRIAFVIGGLNPRIACVMGGLRSGDERRAQYEGIADQPAGQELDRLKELYFQRFPDGRDCQRWPGLVYVRARPMWIRYSDYNQNPPVIVE